MSGRAWVTVDSKFLAERLCLPQGVEVVRADTSGFDFNVRFGLQGGSLPEAPEGGRTDELSMFLRYEEKHGDIRRVYAAFSHAPEREWLVEERQLGWQPIATLFRVDTDIVLWNPCDGVHLIDVAKTGLRELDQIREGSVFTHWRKLAPPKVEAPAAEQSA